MPTEQCERHSGRTPVLQCSCCSAHLTGWRVLPELRKNLHGVPVSGIYVTIKPGHHHSIMASSLRGRLHPQSTRCIEASDRVSQFEPQSTRICRGYELDKPSITHLDIRLPLSRRVGYPRMTSVRLTDGKGATHDIHACTDLERPFTVQ